MEMLSEDDLNLRQMTPEELALAWDLWFDLAQVYSGSSSTRNRARTLVSSAITCAPRTGGSRRPCPAG